MPCDLLSLPISSSTTRPIVLHSWSIKASSLDPISDLLFPSPSRNQTTPDTYIETSLQRKAPPMRKPTTSRRKSPMSKIKKRVGCRRPCRRSRPVALARARPRQQKTNCRRQLERFLPDGRQGCCCPDGLMGVGRSGRWARVAEGTGADGGRRKRGLALVNNSWELEGFVVRMRTKQGDCRHYHHT